MNSKKTLSRGGKFYDILRDKNKMYDANMYEMRDLLGARAIDAVNSYAKSGQPFLISLHFNAPHWPWEAPGDEAEVETGGGGVSGNGPRIRPRTESQFTILAWSAHAFVRRYRCVGTGKSWLAMTAQGLTPG